MIHNTPIALPLTHARHHPNTISHHPGSQGGSAAAVQWASVYGPSEAPCGRARPRWSPAAAPRGEPEAQSGHLCSCQPGWKDGGGGGGYARWKSSSFCVVVYIGHKNLQ